MESLLNKLKILLQRHPKWSKLICAIAIFYILNKFYSAWKYSHKIFNSLSQKSENVIFITGCDSGFGNAIALKLSVNLGYPVIATCLKQESVDKFNNNKQFIASKSISTKLDITNKKQIEECRQFVINYLNKINARLWGIVNNAGIAISGQFELVPHELDKLERDILFFGPLNIIRALLPLLPGRMHCNENDKSYGVSDGGRIVNISSCTASMLSDTRYGVSKGSMSYFSHSLRNELSQLFGIWVCPIEPAVYGTSIFENMMIWNEKLVQNLTQNNKTKLLDIYQFDIKKFNAFFNELRDKQLVKKQNLDEVIECVIHGLIGKYPKRVYKPGWTIPIKLITISPYWIQEKFTNLALFIY